MTEEFPSFVLHAIKSCSILTSARKNHIVQRKISLCYNKVYAEAEEKNHFSKNKEKKWEKW